MSTQPYPGLRPFQRDENDIFFGREHQIDDLLIRLQEQHFLAIMGASGCGKSSLVRAGLLPALDSGFMGQVGAHWAIAEMRPGDTPFLRLTEGLLDDATFAKGYLCEDDTRESIQPMLLAELSRGPRSLFDILNHNPLPEQTHLLILVDQFEEIFRYQQQHQHEAARFVNFLLESAKHDDIYIVITMRSDFLGEAAQFLDLPETINRGLYLTPRLTRNQLYEAITLPARVYGGEVTSELANYLVNESCNHQDQLPLLQHALMRHWSGDQDHILTLEELRQQKGLQGSLNEHLNQTFDLLKKEQQKTSHVMLCALTEYTPNGHITRRPVKLNDLCELTEKTSDELRDIIAYFTDPSRNFLFLANGIVDITNESLIRQWGRLRFWILAESEKAAIYQRLEEAAQRHQEQRGELWFGSDLEIATQWYADTEPTAQWAKRYRGDFQQAIDFLDASTAAEQATRKADRERRHQALQRARKQTLWAIIAFLGALALALWGWTERQKAIDTEHQRSRDLFNSQLTHAALYTESKNFSAARTLLNKSRQLDADVKPARQHARNALAAYVDIMEGEAEASSNKIGSSLSGDLSISPDGHWLAASGEKSMLMLFHRDTLRQQQQLKGHQGYYVWDIVFDPWGHYLYSAGSAGKIIAWRAPEDKDGEWQQALSWQLKYPALALALSPDNTTLAVGDERGDVHLWTISTGELHTLPHEHQHLISHGSGLAFSADNRYLASTSYDGSVLLWDWQAKKVINRFQHPEGANGVAFSPDNRYLASSGDHAIHVWDIKRGIKKQRLHGHKNRIFSLQFIPSPHSANDWQLVSASHDHSLRIWDVNSGVVLRTLQGHVAGVTGLAIWQEKAQAATLYSAGVDGSVKRWSLAKPGQWLLDVNLDPKTVSISPNGQYLALGFKDGHLDLYDLPNKQFLQRIKAHHYDINRLDFSPDSHLLASASADKQVKLWRFKGDNKLVLEKTLSGHNSTITALRFSPKGDVIASADEHGKIGLFALNDKNTPSTFIKAHDSKIAELSFAQDGQQLLSTGYKDNQLKLWSINPDGLSLAHRQLQTEDIRLTGTLSPDNTWLANAGRKQIINLYRLKDNDIIDSKQLIGNEQTIYRTIFSPDSAQLISASLDGSIRFWDLYNEQQLFALQLPVNHRHTSSLWDFNFRCTPSGCWIAVPLMQYRKIALYNLGNIYGD